MSVQTLYTAATGMDAMQTKLDVIANNLANINTTAFKRDRANFEDLLYRNEIMPVFSMLSQTRHRPASRPGWGLAFKVRSPTIAKVPSKIRVAHWTSLLKGRASSKSPIRFSTQPSTREPAISISMPTVSS